MPMRRMGAVIRHHLVGILSLTILSACMGSGDGPTLGKVTGVVTLDGRPLPSASVFFAPEEGRPSRGVTDMNGRYELSYAGRPGAKVGSHLVRISTAIAPMSEDESNAIQPRENVPAIYNSETTLHVEVKPGSNDLDFELVTK
ncbi:hypothetical protein Pan216_38310 [Planctomycetes bacterium Pan216]|uniref:Carboxypeptidase regulatory-like domain-containing protein n=1 Tax=Kolteria novifilia TaxID=2527975 RepID=A0A518B7K8_9BACT|nr:hypothetical protein Pan216_38310 [Planctomycetes bacterium Pan216]